MFMEDALRILTNLTGQEYEAFRVVRDALYRAETQINDIRNLNDALNAAEQRAAEAEGLLRIIASYDYSLDCPYCTIRNDGIHEPGCEYQAIVKYLEGVEVAGRARSAQTRIDDI